MAIKAPPADDDVFRVDDEPIPIDIPAMPRPDLPEVCVTGRHLRDKTASALSALQIGNDPPLLFVRAGALCRVGEDEHGSPVIQSITEGMLRGSMARSANYVGYDKRGDDYPTAPPIDVVRDIMALGKWPFPALAGITETPVLTPDGTVDYTPGYNYASELFYVPEHGMTMPAIPMHPSSEEVAAAVNCLKDIICDFPFVDHESETNALAMLLTPVLRPMVKGCVPLAMIDKPQAGTGASLLAEITSLIATGRNSAMLTAPRDEESWRKTITSLLLLGRTVVTLDNVEAKLYAPSLAAALTANTWQDRILGRSEMVSLPQRVTWIATGNNVRLGGDLPRRCYWIRLDAKRPQPWQRTQFKHEHLTTYVYERRELILAAMLTLARAWISAGMPKPKNAPVVGSFEDWVDVVGGVLETAGVEGFLGNVDAMYAEVDDDTPQWEGFLLAWYDKWHGTAKLTSEVAAMVATDPDFAALVPDDLMSDRKEDKGFSRRLGKALSKRDGMCYSCGISVSRDRVSHSAVRWVVGHVDDRLV